MIKRYFCTYFDSNYLPHARALHLSLIKHNPHAMLFMFCMDDNSFEQLNSLHLPQTTILSYKDLENGLPKLLEAKSNRTRVEYFYTCSAAICYYVLQTYPEADAITYLDSDLYFYASVEPLFDELADASIGIIEHNFSWAAKRNIIYGKFNVGWITFKRDNNGLACVKKWLNNCIDWCYQKLEGNKYGDQKYLDSWPEEFEGVKIIKHKGANVAMWNIGKYKLSFKNDKIYIDKEELIFYHFASLKQIKPFVFASTLSRVFVRTSNIIKTHIYIPYIQSLIKFGISNLPAVVKKEVAGNKFLFQFKKCIRSIRRILFPDIISLEK